METWIKIVLLFVALSLPMRCFGEYRQEQQRIARVEAWAETHTHLPECNGRAHLFTVDRDGILHYSCDWR